jgi:hypothetical protein
MPIAPAPTDDIETKIPKTAPTATVRNAVQLLVKLPMREAYRATIHLREISRTAVTRSATVSTVVMISVAMGLVMSM